MAGRRTKVENEKRARESLVQTLTKINALEPTLGGKWKRHMVAYYTTRLAELVLYQCGFSEPSQSTISFMATRITHILGGNYVDDG